MKIDRLYTLSQFVSAMDDYTKESHSYERACKKIIKYNDFLKQPLTKDMFVNPFEWPNSMEYLPDYDIQKYPSECYLEDKENYESAEKRLIFSPRKVNKKDCYVLVSDHIFVNFIGNKIYIENLHLNTTKMLRVNTMHELSEVTKGELEINLEI